MKHIYLKTIFSLFKLLGLLTFDHHAPTSFKLIFALFSVRFYSVYKVLLQCAFSITRLAFFRNRTHFCQFQYLFIYYILIYAYIKADINAHINQSAIFKILQYYKFFITDGPFL